MAVGDAQLAWLADELAAAAAQEQRVLVFSHLLLHPSTSAGGGKTLLWNYDAVLDVLGASAQRGHPVAAVFSGHQHQGGFHTCEDTGTHFVVLESPLLAEPALYAVGQTFLSFQWDILLLEANALAVLLPLSAFEPRPVRVARGDALTTPPPAIMWAFRALFFKLMLLSGTVKLQSRCPTWLGLTALDYHFATQCIPTPLAQLAHGTPAALRRFGVAFTLFVEGPGTLLIVLPGICRELRLVSLWAQGLLQRDAVQSPIVPSSVRPAGTRRGARVPPPAGPDEQLLNARGARRRM